MFGSRSSASATHAEYRRLSACARGDHTAGPRLRLSSLNWMPVASIARPIRPPSASISRTRWPFAVPPTAGLQGMCADGVARQRAQPDVAAQPRGGVRGLDAGVSGPDDDDVERHDAFSITDRDHDSHFTTSALLSDAEPLEDMPQHVVAVRAPTISSRRARAACRSASTNSSGVSPAAAADAAAASDARASSSSAM